MAVGADGIEPPMTATTGGDLRVYLVSRDFKERLVFFDLVANLFEPFGDGAFDDGLAHLRHYDIGSGCGGRGRSLWRECRGSGFG
jgi:hypothetical protein